MASRSARLTVAAALVAAASPALTAQQPADTATLRPVVVTATRVPTPQDAVAQAVTVITGAELRGQGIRTVAEALRQVPAATIVATGSFGGQTSLFLRGGESDYVKVLLDGVPLNDPGGAFDFADLTTDAVERIEIVRGPASVLYGSDAVAGVIQIFTRDGAGHGAAQVRVRGAGGSYGSGLLDGELSGGTQGGALGYSLAASRTVSDGTFPFNNRYENTVWSARLRVRPDANSDVGLTLRHGDNAYHFPTDGAGQLSDSNQFTADRGPSVALDAGRRLGGRTELRLLLGFSERDARYDDDPDSPGDTAFVYSSRQQVRRRSAEARANVTVGRGETVTAGVGLEDARLHSADSCTSAFGPCSSPPLDTSRSTAALFAQAQTDPRRRWTINAGLRLDDNSQFGTFVTWRTAAAWRMGVATRLRLSAGAGFKEPTFVENYATGFAIGNPSLDPERSLSWEGGVEQEVGPPGRRVTLLATYFHQRFRDLIEYDFARTPNFVNVAEARAAGVELGAAASLAAGVAAELHYTYLDARVTQAGTSADFAAGERLLRRPAHAAGLGLTAREGRRGSASVRVRFTGERDDLDFSTFPATRVVLPSYTVTDLAVEYAVGSGGPGPVLSIQARVENLFDDRSREVANFPARGRVVIFGGEIRYGN